MYNAMAGRKRLKGIVMNLALITFQQVFIFFLLIAVGIIAIKTGILKAEARKSFSDLLIWLVVPAMVFNSYLVDHDEHLLESLLKAFLLGTILLLMGIAITFLIFRRTKNANKPIIQFACMFSNAGYMGLPLISALFGAEGLLYASAYVTVFNVLLWTVGYGMVSHQGSPKNMALNILKTPVIWALLLGILVFLFRIPVPAVIRQPVEFIGDMNTPLSMLITGMMIAGCDLRRLLKNRLLYPVLAVRMLLIPAASFLLFYLLHQSSTVASVVLLLEACPCAAITSAFAVQFGYDEDLAAGSVVFSTFLSILMLPVWAMLLTAFF